MPSTKEGSFDALVGDLILVFSYSGDSVELTDLVNFSSRHRIPLIGMASKENSLLLKSSNIKILLPKVKETDPTGLVPTSSFSLTLLTIDCLCVCLMIKSKFSASKFKKFHSGGHIGKQLIACKEIMFTGKKLPLVSSKKSIGESIKIITKGKLGVAVIIKNNKVYGIITDGDIRRSKFSKNESVLKICSRKPLYVSEDLLVSKALAIMNNKKVTSLLCSSDKDYKQRKSMFKLKGIVHMHNVIKVQ